MSNIHSLVHRRWRNPTAIVAGCVSLFLAIPVHAQYKTQPEALSHPCITSTELSRWVAKRPTDCPLKTAEVVWAKLCEGEILNGMIAHEPNTLSHGNVCPELVAKPTPKALASYLDSGSAAVSHYARTHRVHLLWRIVGIVAAALFGLILTIMIWRRTHRSAFTDNIYEQEENSKWS